MLLFLLPTNRRHLLRLRKSNDTIFDAGIPRRLIFWHAGLARLRHLAVIEREESHHHQTSVIQYGASVMHRGACSLVDDDMPADV
jgi:hypothetical protein